MMETADQADLILRDRLGIVFRNKDLLREALTHRSYSSENGLAYDNERLEFLGDAVIQLAVTEHVFKFHRNKTEGALSDLRSAVTRQETLAKFAKGIGLDNLILLGKGERKSGGSEKPTILADAFEALLGAAYLEAGFIPVFEFLVPLIREYCEQPDAAMFEMNPKGTLQEFVQSRLKSKPKYSLDKTEGPDHQKMFTVSVAIDGRTVASACASSLKQAEMKAAAMALEQISAKKKAAGKMEADSSAVPL